jgi:hypothetical protein
MAFRYSGKEMGGEGCNGITEIAYQKLLKKNWSPEI